MSPRQFVWLLGTLAIAAVILLLAQIPRRPQPPSPPIAVWFSEMGANADPTNYLPIDSGIAKDGIERSERLDVFDVLVGKPDESDAGRIELNVLVGCYQIKGPNETQAAELRISIPELKVHEPPKEYKTLSGRFLDEIAEEIRRCILDKRPPEGSITYLQPRDKALAELQQSQALRQARLNVGRSAGVREGDVFQVVPSRTCRFFGRSKEIKILEAHPMESVAQIPWDQEIETGWGVKWKKPEY
jgi:hypothetical protein